MKPQRLVCCMVLAASLSLFGGCATTSVERIQHEEPARTFCRQLPPTTGEGTCEIEGDPEAAALLLRGDVLLEDRILVGGEVLLSGGKILAARCDTSDLAPPETARITCPTGAISPGMINLHDHVGYNVNPPFPLGKPAEHRHQWRKGLDGFPMVVAPKAEASRGFVRAEWRQILAGTTSVAGGDGYRGGLRNLNAEGGLEEGLAPASWIIAETFPLGDRDGQRLLQTCRYPAVLDAGAVGGRTVIAHVAEGTSRAARNEFLCLSQDGDRSLLGENNALAHAIALKPKDARRLADSGTAVVWSPRSNFSLYGKTAPVELFDRLGIELALGTDWTPSGSIHLLRELSCAARWSQEHFRGRFSAARLWRMTTSEAADAVGLGDHLGRLRPGALADIAVFDHGGADPFEALLDMNITRVALVLRAGEVLYGDTEILGTLGEEKGCESVSLCGKEKTLCLVRDTGLTFDEVSQHAPDEYDFFFCEAPPDEPPCVP